ncbi:MAG: methyl-accepting chemotaxis protein [Treponema sp.]|jgi:archaellum component FlaC|nr:methyl-accepting chemotaxis protein [Treponema sp.]
MANKKNNSANGGSESKLESELAKENIALKLKIAQLQGIQSAMPDPYYVRDMDYNVVLWPPAIAKLTGYTEAEAKKLKCYDMFKACVCPPGSQCPTQHCISVKQFLRDVAVDVYHKSGATVHTLVSNAGIYDEKGNPIGAVEVVKDNTVIQNSMDLIGQFIKSIDSVGTNINTAIERVNFIDAKVNEMAHESLSNVKNGVKAGNSVYEKVEYSNKYVGSVQANMKTINESMLASVEKIKTLKAKSETIIQFVTVIQDISAKTNLLAINASIEAAHAGESGRGFKVVADGIRELSKNSNESAQSIKKTIQEVNSLINETTTSLNTTEKDIESGSDHIGELLGFIAEIDNAVKMLLETISAIERAASATAELDEEQCASTESLTKAGKELTFIAEKLTHEFDVVFKAFRHEDMG